MRRLAVILPATIGLILLPAVPDLRFDAAGPARPGEPALRPDRRRAVALPSSGLYLSVPASVGFIALFGIAVLNGIVLLSYITQLREDGAGRRPRRSSGAAPTGSGPS